MRKKDSAGKNLQFFLLKTTINCILKRNLTHRCPQSGHSFPKLGYFFPISKKVHGRSPPLLPLDKCLIRLFKNRLLKIVALCSQRNKTVSLGVPYTTTYNAANMFYSPYLQLISIDFLNMQLSKQLFCVFIRRF